MSDQQRNLNPHKAAKTAMFLWPKDYAVFGGGSMDFWDSLSPRQRNYCRDLVRSIEACRSEPHQDNPDLKN